MGVGLRISAPYNVRHGNHVKVDSTEPCGYSGLPAGWLRRLVGEEKEASYETLGDDFPRISAPFNVHHVAHVGAGEIEGIEMLKQRAAMGSGERADISPHFNVQRRVSLRPPEKNSLYPLSLLHEDQVVDPVHHGVDDARRHTVANSAWFDHEDT